jgi:hypothetical protein
MTSLWRRLVCFVGLAAMVGCGQTTNATRMMDPDRVCWSERELRRDCCFPIKWENGMPIAIGNASCTAWSSR